MTTEVKHVYLAGPMSGYPQFNIPKFYEVASHLREQGFVVINPAELDDPDTQQTCLRSRTGDLSVLDFTWGEVLSRDVLHVADHVKGIVLMPGWAQSRGARLEAFVAVLCGHKLYLWDDTTKSPVTVDADRIKPDIVGIIGG